MINSRRYLNDRLIQTAIARSPNTPSITDSNRLAAYHAAQQADTRADMESAEKSLGLRQRQLDFSKRQNSDRTQLQRDQFNIMRDDFETGKDLAGRANLVNTLGLGVNAYGAYKTMKNTDETIAAMNDYIDSRDDMDDRAKNFFKIYTQKVMAYK